MIRFADRPVFSVLFLIIPTLAAVSLLLADPAPPVLKIILVVVAALALLLRRRWPLVVLAIATLSLVVVIDLVPIAVAGYAVAAAPKIRPRWARWTPAALLMIIPATYAWQYAYGERGAVTLPELVTNVPIVMLLCVVVPVAVGMLVRSRRDQAAAIAELHRSREREARLVADVVRAEERTALAREMHDVVSDKISLISVRAWALTTQAPSYEMRVEAETIRSLSKTTLEELREVMQVLRDPERPAAEGLSALPDLVARSSLNATLRLSPDVREKSWSAAAQQTAYRTVQEALTNVRKHAAGARTEVDVAERDGQLMIMVRNEPGPSASVPTGLPSGGHGLAGLRERAMLIGAKFRAEATDSGGFVVEVRIPANVGIRDSG